MGEGGIRYKRMRYMGIRYKIMLCFSILIQENEDAKI
jgi:hypothetical protein